MRYVRLLMLAVSVIVLAGCAASGPVFQPANPPGDNKALVYIYRPGAFYFSARDAQFFVSDESVAKLSSGGYTQFYIAPGSYTLRQKWPLDLYHMKGLELPLEVEAGKTYYYRFFAGSGSECSGDQICFAWSLALVSEQIFNSEVNECQYQPASNEYPMP